MVFVGKGASTQKRELLVRGGEGGGSKKEDKKNLE